MQATTSFTYHTKIRDVFSEMSQVVVGQDRLLNRLLIGLFTGGHILLEGVPGLAKTLTINTLAKVLELDFQRIQFTPDLLPADLIGTMIFNQKTSEFEVKQGPIFANLILADEVNRSPAKVQAALLEAMQERQVTIGEETFVLDRPFLVLATQNPVRDEINGITISETLERYIIELVFATRKPMDYNLRDEARYIQYGVSPRASINLNLAAKALAYFDRRDYVLPEDIKEVAPDVFNHRIMLNYEAEADGVTTLQVVDSILRKVAIGR
jgi:MoxR-like ATPase